jgi:hypothetical protein
LNNDDEVKNILQWVSTETETLHPSIFAFISLLKRLLEKMNNNTPTARILVLDGGCLKIGNFLFSLKKFKFGLVKLIRGINMSRI